MRFMIMIVPDIDCENGKLQVKKQTNSSHLKTRRNIVITVAKNMLCNLTVRAIIK